MDNSRTAKATKEEVAQVIEDLKALRRLSFIYAGAEEFTKLEIGEIWMATHKLLNSSSEILKK